MVAGFVEVVNHCFYNKMIKNINSTFTFRKSGMQEHLTFIAKW